MNLYKNNFQIIVISLTLILSCSPSSLIFIDGEKYEKIKVKSLIGQFGVKVKVSNHPIGDRKPFTLSIKDADQEFKNIVLRDAKTEKQTVQELYFSTNGSDLILNKIIIDDVDILKQDIQIDILLTNGSLKHSKTTANEIFENASETYFESFRIGNLLNKEATWTITKNGNEAVLTQITTKPEAFKASKFSLSKVGDNYVNTVYASTLDLYEFVLEKPSKLMI
jgi:hypothetical protein